MIWREKRERYEEKKMDIYIYIYILGSKRDQEAVLEKPMKGDGAKKLKMIFY